MFFFNPILNLGLEQSEDAYDSDGDDCALTNLFSRIMCALLPGSEQAKSTAPPTEAKEPSAPPAQRVSADIAHVQNVPESPVAISPTDDQVAALQNMGRFALMLGPDAGTTPESASSAQAAI